VPKEIDDRNLETLKAAYVAATKRSVQAGYEVIEIHGAQ
jgi:2,4-dienoyl-CoA reductase-like NADH-dependent reductase (Old Yellow Enzyme family)